MIFVLFKHLQTLYITMLLFFYVSILLINSFTYAYNTDSPIDSSSSGSQGNDSSSGDSETENDNSFNSSSEDNNTSLIDDKPVITHSFNIIDDSESADDTMSVSGVLRTRSPVASSKAGSTMISDAPTNGFFPSLRGTKKRQLWTSDHMMSVDDSESADDSMSVDNNVSEDASMSVNDSENLETSTKTAGKNYDTYVYFGISLVMLIGLIGIIYYVFNKYSSNNPNVQKISSGIIEDLDIAPQPPPRTCINNTYMEPVSQNPTYETI